MVQALDHLEFDRVVGWGFLHKATTNEVFAVPVVWPWDVDPTAAIGTLPPGLDPVTVIPAVERAHRVTAVYADATEIVLGYQVSGDFHPDWEQEAADRAPP